KFQESFTNKPYERQKDSSEVQLSSFLRSLVPAKKFSAAMAEDIVKFLTSMDAAGKQKLHRLAAGTVDSYIGKLRAIFNRLGRTGFSDPLAHSCVKEYLMFSVPLFYKKFTRLIAYLRGLNAEGSVLSPLNRYLLVRDITFFVTDFYTGDRASDLGRLKADELFCLKDREGFLLNITFNKTRCAGVPLLGEKLFRSSEHKKLVSHRPFGRSAYLKAAGISNGETPHSFRVGISYTLKGLGCTLERIAQYVSWRNTQIALYYTRRSIASTSLHLIER
ncbi:unnamed protein product, partial [Porites lobata]